MCLLIDHHDWANFVYTLPLKRLPERVDCFFLDVQLTQIFLVAMVTTRVVTTRLVVAAIVGLTIYMTIIAIIY